MSELCAYKPCKCLVTGGEMFCGEVCAMLGAQAVNQVKVTTGLPLQPDQLVVPRCACGHTGCGDSQVTNQVN